MFYVKHLNTYAKPFLHKCLNVAEIILISVGYNHSVCITLQLGVNKPAGKSR